MFEKAKIRKWVSENYSLLAILNRCYAHLTFDRSISNPGYTIGILYHQKCPQLRLALPSKYGRNHQRATLGFLHCGVVLQGLRLYRGKRHEYDNAVWPWMRIYGV